MTKNKELFWTISKSNVNGMDIHIHIKNPEYGMYDDLLQLLEGYTKTAESIPTKIEIELVDNDNR
jgi:hypothetical protein